MIENDHLGWCWVKRFWPPWGPCFMAGCGLRKDPWQGKMKNKTKIILSLFPQKCWHPKFIDRTSDASSSRNSWSQSWGTSPHSSPMARVGISRQLYWRLWLRWRWCWAQRICRSKILWCQKVELQDFMKSNSVRRHWEVLVWRRSSCNLVLSSSEGLQLLHVKDVGE